MVATPEGSRASTPARTLNKEGFDVVQAKQGDEVAIGIEGVTVGRQINEEDVLYVDLIESAVKQLPDLDLNDDEKLTLDETIAIKRKEDPFWGM